MMPRLPRILIILSILLTLAMGGISLFNALTMLGKPFPGFLIYDPPYIASLSLNDWSGDKAGVNFLDRVVALDGVPVKRGGEVLDAIGTKLPGTLVMYKIESGDQVREVTIPVQLFGWSDLFMTFFVTFSCGLVLCTLGIIVVVLKPNMSGSWVFLVWALALGGYMTTGFEIMSGHRLTRFHYIILTLYPFATFHLALIFPERRAILARFPWLEFIIYLPALVLAIAWQVYLTQFPELLAAHPASSQLFSYKILGAITRLFLLGSVLVFIGLNIHSMFRATTTLDRLRARMILFGATLGFLPPTLILLVSHLLEVSPNWNVTPFFVIFFPAAVAYSIIRHNLFDADTVIKYTVGYVIATGIVIGVYMMTSLALNVYLEHYKIGQSRAFPIIFMLGVILVFNPLRNRIQKLVDRLFFRKEYDYGAIVDKVSGAMTSLLDMTEILKRLVDTFAQDLFVNTSSIMMVTPDGTSYSVRLAGGVMSEDLQDLTFARRDPLMEIVEQKKSELTKYDLAEDPRYRAVSDQCQSSFERLHASLMIPMVFQDEVVGLLNLGEKKSGKFYNREDIDLFRTIAQQGAVAIENAMLFQENLEKQRMEEELNIARDLQMSMMPASCPEIKGFEIAALSEPAMEVGGDFYDFIQMDNDCLGIVVGDVTGKSVSGALVMSAARSVFRLLSEGKMSVGEIMTRANSRTKQDIKSGMFVALLYAVLDFGNRVLKLCSAGQTQPIHISSQTGEAELVQTEGDTFPLGILDEADYQETQIPLAPGDKIILYTDGIVEAMNEEKEMYGFDRFIASVKNSRHLNADALLKEILAEVNDFVGQAKQHDDITLIVFNAMD